MRKLLHTSKDSLYMSGPSQGPSRFLLSTSYVRKTLAPPYIRATLCYFLEGWDTMNSVSERADSFQIISLCQVATWLRGLDLRSLHARSICGDSHTEARGGIDSLALSLRRKPLFSSHHPDSHPWFSLILERGVCVITCMSCRYAPLNMEFSVPSPSEHDCIWEQSL